MKTHIRYYDVICSYIENTYTTLWRHTNLCCLCQMLENTDNLVLGGYEELLRHRFVITQPLP